MAATHSSPTYRERLRVEGAGLAASGLAASLLLLATRPEARRWPLSTLGQLALVALLLGTRGRRSLGHWLAESEPLRPDEVSSGEPTPLWQLPAIVGGLALSVSRAAPFVPRALAARAGWDASLRVTAGAALVGLFQALVAEREVARHEADLGRTHYRLPGSRLGRGTRLGWTPALRR